MKKVMCIILTILELSFFAGAFIVNYFTKKKMGMLRHVIGKNSTFEKLYPIDSLKSFAICIFVIMLILVFVLYRKRKTKNINNLIICLILVIAYTIFVFAFSTSTIKAYYYILFLSGIGVFIHLIKSLIFIPRIKN